MNSDTIKSAFQSATTKKILAIIFILIVVIFVFNVGEEFGYHKAEVMEQMSSGYGHTFAPHDMRHNGPFGYLSDDQTGTHGVAGKVVSMTENKILVADNEGIEKTVLTDSNTIIRKQRDTITEAEIKPDDFVIVIGTPNNSGQITAKIIRIVPSPQIPENTTASTTQNSNVPQ